MWEDPLVFSVTPPLSTLGWIMGSLLTSRAATVKLVVPFHPPRCSSMYVPNFHLNLLFVDKLDEMNTQAMLVKLTKGLLVIEKGKKCYTLYKTQLF